MGWLEREREKEEGGGGLGWELHCITVLDMELSSIVDPLCSGHHLFLCSIAGSRAVAVILLIKSPRALTLPSPLIKESNI